MKLKTLDEVNNEIFGENGTPEREEMEKGLKEDNKHLYDEDKKFKVKSCIKTCFACPSQWDIYTTENKYIYVRYRWGRLTLTLDAFTDDSKVIFSEGIGEDLDGSMSTDELKQYTNSILDWSLI